MNTKSQFLSINLEDLLVGEPLPVSLFVYIDFRFITFRAKGDVVNRAAYDRLEFKKVKNLFVAEADKREFMEWSQGRYQEIHPPVTAAAKNFVNARDEVHRKTLDIFQSTHPDKIVTQTLSSSKKLVNEVMKFPYAVQSLAQLQIFSKGTVDHSVNVSVLSVYLAMQMGYSHQLILQHVSMGALLHDVGKTRVPVEDSDNAQVYEEKMKEHPTLGNNLMETQSKVPNEVKMIIAQHHECHDGSGFPKKLRGNNIYDLARIVAIANVFDEIVTDQKGSLVERQKAAIKKLDEDLYRKFDPQKLDKAIKILKLGV